MWDLRVHPEPKEQAKENISEIETNGMSIGAQTAELIGILIVMAFGVVLVFMLSNNTLSSDQTSKALVWPLTIGISCGCILSLVFLHPKEWLDTEKKLRKIQMTALSFLFLLMMYSAFDNDYLLALQSLSFILGVAFGAITIVSIRFLKQIWS